MIIYRGEETIHKADKSPGDIECYSDGKKDDTANCITFRIRMLKSNAPQKEITRIQNPKC